MQGALDSPHFTAAAHAVLLSHAAAIPAIKRLSLRQVATALGTMGQRLRFVRSCHTRMVLQKGGKDVTRNDTPLKVGRQGLGMRVAHAGV